MLGPMHRGLAIALLLLATGCGARTALEGREPADRQRDAGPDAFAFDGFPCRWSLGQRLEIRRGRSISELTGAVHPMRDQLVVMATVDGERAGARVALGIRSELLSPVAGADGELFTGADGWLRQAGQACGIVPHDDLFTEGEPFFFGGGMFCRMAQSEIGRVESMPVEVVDRGLSITYPATPEPLVEAIPGVVGGGDGALVRDLERGAVVAHEAGPVLRVTRASPRGETESARWAHGEPVSAALDRVFGRALLLAGGEGTASLVHVDWDGALVLEPHAELPPPAGRLRSNETEALVPLRDGTMAFLPLPMSRVRFTDPVEEDRQVEAMEIVLRPGQSVGGLLYVHREPTGEALLAFRALVCNR